MAMMNDRLGYWLLVLYPCLIANIGKIASLGGIEAIMKAMSTHKDHSGVQEKACRALFRLATNDGMVRMVLILTSCTFLFWHITLMLISRQRLLRSCSTTNESQWRVGSSCKWGRKEISWEWCDSTEREGHIDVFDLETISCAIFSNLFSSWRSRSPCGQCTISISLPFLSCDFASLHPPLKILFVVVALFLSLAELLIEII